MGLVVVDEGMIRQLRAVTSGWPYPRRMGLFSNELTLSRHTILDQLVPCEFSGYTGEIALGFWAVPTIQGDRAVSTGDPLTWTYDGGDPTGWVTGYYVVDDDGVLLWAELLKPVAMVVTGQQLTIRPRLSAGTRYGGET